MLYCINASDTRKTRTSFSALGLVDHSEIEIKWKNCWYSLNLAVSIFNDDFTIILEVMQMLNLTIGLNCFSFCVESDKRRVRFFGALIHREG